MIIRNLINYIILTLKNLLLAKMLFFYEATFLTWSNDDAKQNISVNLNSDKKSL
jgi:hypothetical protein